MKKRESAGGGFKDLGEMEVVPPAADEMNEEDPREERNEQQAVVEDDITEIISAEIEMAPRNMENGKATEPDNLPIEVWTSVERTGVNFLKKAFDKITDEEKILDI